ncbi:hypothetical protein [Ruania alba]|uniref:hypothetical protein n=1 Tax=Ruania alba TaxID=648782 RepID=UPI000B7F142A|nr:hypothetical protein [Ruania alba]
MGWGRTLLLGDVGNRLDIEDVEASVGNLRSQLNHMHRNRNTRDDSQDAALQAAKHRIAELEGEVEDLMLYVTGLAELLVTHAGVPREKVERLVGAVDRDIPNA